MKKLSIFKRINYKNSLFDLNFFCKMFLSFNIICYDVNSINSG